MRYAVYSISCHTLIYGTSTNDTAQLLYFRLRDFPSRWGNNFLDLVRACCEHAAGKTELFSHMYTKEEKEKTFWMCIFAVNQHVSICKDCPCGREKYTAGHPMCQMDKFPMVIEQMKYHALAMDSKLKTLTRVWVLSEIDGALNGNNKMQTRFCGTVSQKNIFEPEVPSVEDAEASYEEDKDMIVCLIKERKGGIEKFDKSVRDLTLFEIAKIRLYELISSGKIDEVTKELNSNYGERLLNVTNSKFRGETPIMFAARYGFPDIVRLFLERGADVTIQTAEKKWTVLHYAAICFNLETQPEIVQMLLEDGKCNPHELNSFRRTALEECILMTGSEEIATAILARSTNNAFALLEKSIKSIQDDGDFTPLPHDAFLFSHNVLRQDTWTRPDTAIAVKQPLGDEIVTYNDWVKPIEFGTATGEIIYGQWAQAIIEASRRYAAYIKYRWPLWEFRYITFRYTTVNAPQHYRIDLVEGTLAQVEAPNERGMNAAAALYYKHDVTTRVPCSIRLLYP